MKGINCCGDMENEKWRIEYIRGQLTQGELLCQLAEEAAELSKAALKLRRAYDGTNPTPVKREEAYENLKEEIADVWAALKVLGLDGDVSECEEISHAKIQRWFVRLKAVRKEG